MAMSLSKLIDNLCEGIHNNKCVDCKSCLDYIKTKNERLILKCFNCEQHSRINEEFIKNYNENSYKGYILEVDVKYSDYIVIYHSYLKE